MDSITVEAERMELSASRPQLDYAWAMWENLVACRSVPADRLAAQALKKEDPTFQLDLSRPRLDWARSAATNCAGIGLGSLDASVLPADSSSSVRILRSMREGPPEWTAGSNFLDGLVQIPSSIFRPESEADPFVLNLRMGSYDLRLHTVLLHWLNYIRPGPAGPGVLVHPQERPAESAEGQRSNQSVYARDSGLSSSAEGTHSQTFRASSERARTAHSDGSASEVAHQLDWAACRRSLQRSIIYVDIQPGGLTLPTAADGHLEVRLQLPAVSVTGQQGHLHHRGPTGLSWSDLPFLPAASGPSSFPWAVSLEQLGLSTADPNGGLIRRPVLAPLSLKCAVALNDKSAETSGMDLCIHIDMNAVEVSMDVAQVAALCFQTDQLSEWLAVFPSAATATASAGGPPQPGDGTTAGTPPAPPADVGLWLQWAMPRFLLSLESSGARTLLDMEDVTTSVDLKAGQYAKLKSRLTALSVKLLTRSATDSGGWISEPATNGIVLSIGGEEITRDLQVEGFKASPAIPSAGASPAESSPAAAGASPVPSEGGEQQQAGQQLPADGGVSSPSSSSGPPASAGVLSLTVTAARRHHVHSRWQAQQQQRRKSLADQEAVQQLPEDSDYLYEVALAVEPIDLVVTPILLGHLNGLVQPLHSLQCLKGPPEGSKDDQTAQSLPLVFASGKGLRLFLVDQTADGFLLLNLDGAELSPRVQNPLGRTGGGLLLKPDLYAEAEASGQLFVPGRDVEDRQYQVDLTGLSFSSGLLRMDFLSRQETHFDSSFFVPQDPGQRSGRPAGSTERRILRLPFTPWPRILRWNGKKRTIGRDPE